MSAATQIYTQPGCPYCARAKALLTERGAHYTEIDAPQGSPARTEVVARSGRRTVPQIFIGDRHVGGCDDLFELDRAGSLAPLLAGAA